MKVQKSKVILVGTGFVGTSFAYSLLNQGGVNELVLIDVNKEKAQGEALDLAHGIAYAPGKMNIRFGDYTDCKDASIVVITAGINQKPGQTRLELVETNAKITKSIVEQVMGNGFNGIFVVASNPVDIMTYVVQKVSKMPTNRVIGSGTMLDTSRLRYLIGEGLEISPKNTHAYVMGEHGDSSFVPWEHCYIGCKKLLDIAQKQGKTLKDLENIRDEVKNAAYEIIEKKQATYYGIGVALTRLVKAILNDEEAILTVSTFLNGEYNEKDIYIGVPAIITNKGVREILELPLQEIDQNKLSNSCNVLRDIISKLDI
ncbi:MAG: L-lactate dehydrogenase [Clostridia bacterium]|nr:L-lactate dehydrogenase [Clostridia bacterium]